MPPRALYPDADRSVDPAADAAGDTGRPLRAALVLLAAGEGRRTGHATNKVLLPLSGRRVFTWSLRWAREVPGLDTSVLVIREQDRDAVSATVEREVDPPEPDVVVGGDSRHASEWAALQVLAPAIESGALDVVVIHDAARPLAGTALFAEVVSAAAEHGGAIPVREQPQLAEREHADGVPDRVVAVQTPQAFRARPLLEAYRRAAADGFVGTDTASCMERYTDLPVHCVTGDAANIKITFPEDLFLAERLLAHAGWDLTAGTSPQPAHEPGHRLHLPLAERLHAGGHRP
ncbi:MAG: IspD/TarI family cytidylyltransferase [Nocardioides sp.]